jgi:hypothetical protein
MNLSKRTKAAIRNFSVLLVSMMLPLYVSAQKKPAAPSHPSAPAHASAPHTNTTHTNTAHTNTTHTNNTRTNTNRTNTRTNTTRSTTTRSTTTTRGGNNTRGGNTRTTTTRTTTTRTTGGGRSETRANGSVHNFNSRGVRTSVRTRSGAEGHFNSRGRVTSIHAHGMTINHGAHGATRFESRRNGVRLVGYGHGRGYAERGYMRGGRPYMRRTYYYGGRRYAYAYRGAYWHGVAYYGYVPPYYYGRAFYGWAYNPWAAPIAWGWGWGAAPWYGYYGAYFAPAPVYATPALWLTDYLIAANLQAAYESRAAADAAAANAAASAPPPDSDSGGQPAASNGPVAMTPEVKQAIADEVRAQIQAEQQEAANPNPPAAASTDQVPAALDPAHRTFVVSAVLNPAMADGTECSLSPGDVLTRIQDTPDANQNVTVLVSSSQNGDCASGSQVPVAVQDLQDMQNDFRAKIDDGLSQMAANQGKNGMPGGPAANKTASPDGQVQADLTVGDELKDQQAQADQTEQEVKQASSSSSGGND